MIQRLFNRAIYELFLLVDSFIRPPGSIKTAINNTIKYLRSFDRTQSKNVRTFAQLAKHKNGRKAFIQYYSICFDYNSKKVFDTTLDIKAMEIIKMNMECCEEINFNKYPDNIKCIDDLIIYLKIVRDSPEILVMEM